MEALATIFTRGCSLNIGDALNLMPLTQSLIIAVVAFAGTSCGRIGFSEQLAFDGSTDARAMNDGTDDDDNDGVGNSIDNCGSLANPTQRDFDADGVGDVCDNCPVVSNALQSNTDADDLGDACDPQPSVASDRLIAFTTFDGNQLPSQWTSIRYNLPNSIPSTITINNNQATLDVANDNIEYITTTMPTGNIFVTAQMQLLSYTGPGGFGFRNVGVVSDYDTASDSGLLCMQNISATDTSLHTINLVTESNANQLLAIAAMDWVDSMQLGAPDVYQLSLQRSTTDGSCKGDRKFRSNISVNGVLPTIPGDRSRIGLRVRGSTVRVHYILITSEP
jgi:hypothetical protein